MTSLGDMHIYVMFMLVVDGVVLCYYIATGRSTIDCMSTDFTFIQSVPFLVRFMSVSDSTATKELALLKCSGTFINLVLDCDCF